jgi:hypothetical protein
LYWIYTGPPGVANPAPDQWELTGQFCSTPGQGGRAASVPVVTAQEFRRLPLPAGIVHIQPGNGRTLINVPTNTYVEARTIVLPTTVLGQRVNVRATPVTYDWVFGDGEKLHTSDPGAPYPDLRTAHTYLTTGTMTVALTTTYRGEYAVNGGPWQPIDGVATVTSPTVPLAVVAAHAALVDDPLPS